MDGRKQRKNYSEEFKQEAVRLIAEEGYSFSAAAQAVGVSEQGLRVGPARVGPPPAPCGDDATLAELKAENARLRKQLRRAELEREILKKATAYFAKESL